MANGQDVRLQLSPLNLLNEIISFSRRPAFSATDIVSFVEEEPPDYRERNDFVLVLYLDGGFENLTIIFSISFRHSNGLRAAL